MAKCPMLDAYPVGLIRSSAQPVRCAAYMRVSTDEQSTANQLPAVEQLARARGYAAPIVYSENASAAKRRPVFEKLREDARRGEFQVLLVWALDRLGRDTVGNLLAIRELDRLGVRVVSVQENWLDTTGPTRELLIAVLSWVAQQERDVRGARTKAGLARVRLHGSKSGKPIGRPRRLDDETIARVRFLRAEGRSIRSIAMGLRIPRATVQRAVANV